MYYVYIIWSNKVGKHYIGCAKNLRKRILQHRKGYSQFTSRADGWELVFSKSVSSYKEARKIEAFIKRQRSKVFIEKLIKSEIVL